MDFFQRYRKTINITSLFYLALFCSLSHSDDNQTWVQLGSGFGAYSFQLKTVTENSGWSLEVAGYYPPTMFEDTIIDRDTNKEVDPMLKVLAVSKLWSSPVSWGYADVGFGLGIGSGSWTKKCKEFGSDFLGSNYECDYHEGTRIGIPLQASVAMGKYVGLGLSLNAFVHSEDAQIRILFTLPLGKFTK
jgi:hypothetical protein